MGQRGKAFHRYSSWEEHVAKASAELSQLQATTSAQEQGDLAQRRQSTANHQNT